MRSRVIAGLAILGAVYGLWHFAMTRTASTRLPGDTYTLSLAMAWGWGMEERIAIRRIGALWPGPSSGWIELWKRPYNSGLSVYRSTENGTYYLGALYQLYIFEPGSGTLRASCNIEDVPPRTVLGEQLSSRETTASDAQVDPGTVGLFNYIGNDEETGDIPPDPPDSTYYRNLKYLGKFGLVRSEGRGNEVRFVPANRGREPRLSLDIRCG